MSVASIVIGLGIAAPGASAAYPDKPVRFIVPFAPGGTNDILGRIVAEKMAVRLGQPFVIDNRAGANSVIGCEIVARANPDGHTLLVESREGRRNQAGMSDEVMNRYERNR